MTEDKLVSREVLADQVKDRLLEAILAGRYAPDSRIVETRIAREYGTSQAPVREALRGLEALGLVEITPFRGARVRRPSRKEMVEAYVVRAELESLGARLAVPRLTDADIAELVALGDTMQRAARAGNGHAVAIADASLHGLIIRLAGNATLERVWRALEPFSNLYHARGPRSRRPMDGRSPSAHPRLVRRRDTEGLARALREHFQEVAVRLGEEWADTQLPTSDPSSTPRR